LSKDPVNIGIHRVT